MFNPPPVSNVLFFIIENGCSEYGKCYVLDESRIIAFGLNLPNKTPH